jgi:hypothetical protein
VDGCDGHADGIQQLAVPLHPAHAWQLADQAHERRGRVPGRQRDDHEQAVAATFVLEVELAQGGTLGPGQLVQGRQIEFRSGPDGELLLGDREPVSRISTVAPTART